MRAQAKQQSGQPQMTKKCMVRTTAKFRQIHLEKTNESIENLFLGKKTAMQWKRVFLATKTYGTQKNNENQLKKAKFRNFLLNFKALTYN